MKVETVLEIVFILWLTETEDDEYQQYILPPVLLGDFDVQLNRSSFQV